jgi:hypothetical protein
MKLTPALFFLNISFAFLIFLGRICLANAFSAQEKLLLKSVDLVVENKNNYLKNNAYLFCIIILFFDS